jgi:SAM-dependent methyltransferase
MDAVHKSSWDAMIGLGSYDLDRPDPWVVEEIARNTSPRGRVIDVGCGNGRHTVALCRAGLWTTGVDIAPSAIENTAAMARGAGLDCLMVRCDMQALPFADAVFDTVLAWRTCYLQKKAGIVRAVADAARVLRPGGFLLASFRSTTNTLFYVGRDKGRRIEENTYYLDDGNEFYGVIYHFFSRRELLSLFGGYEVVNCEKRELSHTRFTVGRPELSNNFWVLSAFKKG